MQSACQFYLLRCKHEKQGKEGMLGIGFYGYKYTTPG
jgi:hypothetical protein